MRETGRQQEATRFKSKQNVIIYNFRETLSKFKEFTQSRDIKASKVKKMHTRDISKGNASYLKLNKVSHDASKRHVIPPRHVVCGRCGHVDSVEGRTLEIRNVLETSFGYMKLSEYWRLTGLFEIVRRCFRSKPYVQVFRKACTDAWYPPV